MTASITPDCYHCALKVYTGEKYSALVDGESRLFCCPACQTVAQTIVNGGMKSFYQFRTSADSPPSMESLAFSFSAFDDSQFQQRFVVQQPQQGGDIQATVHLLIAGIHCAACVWLLENYIRRLPGVESVTVSLTEHRATLVWKTGVTCLSTLCRAIAQLGYQPEPYDSRQLEDFQHREHRTALKRLGVAGIAMMQVGMFSIALYAGGAHSIAIEYRDLLRWVSLLVTTPVVFYSAKPFFTGAWRGVLMAKPGMDLPVAIAITLAYIASCRATISGTGYVYFDSVTMFTCFLLTGRYLEMRARHFSGKLTSNDINSLLPSTAIKRIHSLDKWQSVPLFKIKTGDTVLIKPGQIVPVDGCVIDGCSGVNEASLTGEFMLQHKHQGDPVLAGTLNGEGTLTIMVEATGAQLQLQTIATLLNQAQLEKPFIAQWADHIASYFVVAVLIIAAITYLFWWWFDRDNAFWVTLSVLVVSCPCALSLATPAALAAATSRLRQLGLLVTSAQVWEKIPTLTHVVCDKTGTLTEGKLSITSVKVLSSLTSSQCMNIAAALEVHSEHPIATAFVGHNTKKLAKNIEVSIGLGIEGVIGQSTYRIGTADYVSKLYDSKPLQAPTTVGQWVFLANQKGPVCSFELQDTVRNSAVELIKTLKNNGFVVHMLSGDPSRAASDLSHQLGIDYCTSGVSAEEKLAYIHQLHKEGAGVLMLGDGINDIPVLTAADVSIAMCDASNLAKANADCILLSGELGCISDLIDIAGKTRRIIRQNLFWALVYNLSAIPLAAMAILAPYAAAIGMSLSSLVVIINSLRLQNSSIVRKKRLPPAVIDRTVKFYSEGVS